MLLIKQVQIVDGSGDKPFIGDVLIAGQKISAIGNNFSKKKDEEVIDGFGMIITPGFIDVNNTSDHHLSIFTNPDQKNFIKQGVTTIIGGQCGSSLAPLMYGSLTSINRWANTDKTNVDWISIKELLRVLDRVKLGINFETLIGYSTIRKDLAGSEIRDLTESEIEIFINILDKALSEGGLGLSTGLGFLDSKFTPYNEIKRFVSLIAKREKVYASYLRNEKEDICRSVEETLRLSRETGAKTIISHFRPFKKYKKEFNKSLNLIEKSLIDSNVYFDVNPFTDVIFPIFTILPYWAQNENVEVMIDNIKNFEKRKIIINELKKIDLSGLTIVDTRGQDILLGKSVLEISQKREIDAVLFLLELMRTSRMKAMLVSKDVDPDLLLPLLMHSRAFIGSNSSDLSFSTFTKYLEIVLKQGISIESAIKKITSFPAQFFGLKNRGLIKEGYFADLVLLKDNKVKNVILNGRNLF
ncbi:amidohydrolase family protein [Patescibacteria group bacterium]|nr:amidohydrolase family protein [Patescibacteria group bacterium]